MPTAAHKKREFVVTIDNNIPDFNKTPFAIKKAERARALIQKYGLPKWGTSKKSK